jgi:hypothetical protein
MKSEYDASKDKVIEEIVVCEGEYNSVIKIGVYQYNNGSPKIGITRWYSDAAGNERTKKLGRLSANEAEELLKVLPDMISKANEEQ